MFFIFLYSLLSLVARDGGLKLLVCAAPHGIQVAFRRPGDLHQPFLFFCQHKATRGDCSLKRVCASPSVSCTVSNDQVMHAWLASHYLCHDVCLLISLVGTLLFVFCAASFHIVVAVSPLYFVAIEPVFRFESPHVVIPHMKILF